MSGEPRRCGLALGHAGEKRGYKRLRNLNLSPTGWFNPSVPASPVNKDNPRPPPCAQGSRGRRCRHRGGVVSAGRDQHAPSGPGGSTRVVPNGFLSLLVFCKSRARVSLGTAAPLSAGHCYLHHPRHLLEAQTEFILLVLGCRPLACPFRGPTHPPHFTSRRFRALLQTVPQRSPSAPQLNVIHIPELPLGRRYSPHGSCHSVPPSAELQLSPLPPPFSPSHLCCPPDQQFWV